MLQLAESGEVSYIVIGLDMGWGQVSTEDLVFVAGHRVRLDWKRAAGAGGAALILLVLLLRLHGERPTLPGQKVPPPTGNPHDIADLDMSRGQPLWLPPAPPGATNPPLHVEPMLPGLPPPVADEPRRQPPIDLAALRESELVVDPSEAARTSLEESLLRPRLIVQPQAPAKVMIQRKIDASVLLRALVGPDGRVRRVVVLRGIPRCAECTESAVDAARRYVFDAPIGSREIWTPPFEIRFSYRR